MFLLNYTIMSIPTCLSLSAKLQRTFNLLSSHMNDKEKSWTHTHETTEVGKCSQSNHLISPSRMKDLNQGRLLRYKP